MYLPSHSAISNLLLSPQFANGWDFSVRGGSGDTSSSASFVLLISEDANWKSLQINYLISSRSDLFLGSFIGDGYIFQSTSNNQLTLTYALPNWKPTAIQVYSVTEFAGLRTFLPQSLSFSFIGTEINGQTGQLKVMIATNSPLEMIYLTYYWWVSGATDITFISGANVLAYPFGGLEAISGTQLTYAWSGFNRAGVVSCTDSSCPQNCVTVAKCESLGGHVSGTACVFCGINSNWSNGVCTCLTNYYLIGGVCTPCPSNSNWDGSACVCQSGYNLFNNQCIVCPPNSVWANSQVGCVCMVNYFMVNGQCISCQANSGWNGTACVCLSGYYVINGACTQCPPNSAWNGSACACQTGYYLVAGVCQQPPPNMVWNGSGFVCANNYHLIGGICSLCPPKSTWNGTACVCGGKQYLINGVCTQCDPRSTYNGSACVCNNGFYLIGGSCSQCQANSAWNGSACVCINGYYPSGKNCLACGANSAWNGSACACNNGYYLINNVCTACSANQVWDGSNCVCAANYYLIGGVCQTCPPNTSWNGSACIPNCSPKAYWNGSACACQSGYNLIQGACLPCDANSVYDGTTCNCNPGFFGNYQLCTACDSSCATCSQAGPNGCTTCPAGITINQGACVAGCGVGRVYFGLVCVNCPDQCVTCSNVNTCTQCAQGYILLQSIVNGNLVIGCTLPGTSSAGSQLALTGIVIGNNVIYQGVTLSSLPTYFLTTNCESCSDLLLVTIIPNNLGITYTTQYVLYSQYWFIIAFSYTSAVAPNFQFKVQINYKYASYFTSADMAQGLFNSVSPVAYPTTPAPVPTPAPAPTPTPSNTTTNTKAAPAGAGIVRTNPTNPLITGVYTAASPTASATASASSTTTVMSSGSPMPFNTATVL